MTKKTETQREVRARIIAKAWTDPEFLQNLRKEPKKVLKREGLEMQGKNVSIVIHENTEEEIHFVIPRTPKEIDYSREEVVRMVANRLQVVTTP